MKNDKKTGMGKNKSRDIPSCHVQERAPMERWLPMETQSHYKWQQSSPQGVGPKLRQQFSLKMQDLLDFTADDKAKHIPQVCYSAGRCSGHESALVVPGHSLLWKDYISKVFFLLVTYRGGSNPSSPQSFPIPSDKLLAYFPICKKWMKNIYLWGGWNKVI